MRRLFVIIISLYGFISSAFAGTSVTTVHGNHHPNQFKTSYHSVSKTISAPVHTKLEDERDILQALHSFSIKIHNYHSKKVLDGTFNRAYLKLLGFGTFSSLKNTSFQVINKRIIIFPFHTFW